MQDQTFNVDTLEQLVFVNVQISCWSGKKTLTPEDLGLDRDTLPPETLVSLGDKQLIHPDALRAFTSIRSAARRHCLAVGTRFLGGYAVPAQKAQGLLDRLTTLGQRYQQAKTAFLATYDQKLADWTTQQPSQWQKLIQDALVPATYVGGRLQFQVQVARVSAPPPAVQHPGLHQALAGLGDQILEEIAQEAKDVLETSFRGKTEVTRRALSPLSALRDKLDGLAFIEGGFRAVIGEIDRLLASIPAKGILTGRVLDDLVQFLALAAQPHGLKTWAAAAPVWVNPHPAWAWPSAEPSPRIGASALTFSEEAEAALRSASAVDVAIVPSANAASLPEDDAEATAQRPTSAVDVAPLPEPATEHWFF